jgi:hypothetical protein
VPPREEQQGLDDDTDAVVRDGGGGREDGFGVGGGPTVGRWETETGCGP